MGPHCIMYHIDSESPIRPTLFNMSGSFDKYNQTSFIWTRPLFTFSSGSHCNKQLKYCKSGNFCKNFIFVNSVKRHICDVKNFRD